uniref:Uncharacterized protein n=1 Tax=Desmodus rotundus TaxID=9430 RepID=K9IXW4_DESRO
MMLNTFSCACWLSACLLWKMSNQIFCPFLNCLSVFMLLSCVSSLLILSINPLSDVSFSSIFSHSLDCLPIWLMVSFAMQKCFIFSLK